MAASIKKCGQIFATQWCQIRHMSRINIQKPKTATLERRIFESVVAPILPKVKKTQAELCIETRRKELARVEEPNPYEEYLYRRCKKIFVENKMIAVCQLLPMSRVELKKIRNKLLYDELEIVFSNNKLMRRAVTEMSKYSNMMPYFCGRNAYILCKDVKLQVLVKHLKKVPNLILLGGLVEDHILSREGFMHFSKYSGIENIYGELVTVLNSSPSNTSRYLSHHLQNLSHNLQQHIQQSTGSAEDSSDSIQTQS